MQRQRGKANRIGKESNGSEARRVRSATICRQRITPAEGIVLCGNGAGREVAAGSRRERMAEMQANCAPWSDRVQQRNTATVDRDDAGGRELWRDRVRVVFRPVMVLERPEGN